MASVKDFRSKPLSSMSYDELSDFIKKAENAGYSRSTSKELGKAEDLRKVLKPENYGSKTVESAKQKLLTNTELETQQKLGIAPVTADTGIPGVDGASLGFGAAAGGTPASIDFNKLYEQGMTSPELVALEKQLADKDAAYSAATTNINDSPYYSEATRTGHIAKLNQTYQIDKQNLVDQIAQKKADVQTKINIAKMQYDVTQQEYQNNIQKLNLLISSGALANASGTDIAQIAVATGISTSMVKGIINKMKADAIKPELFTDSETGKVTAIDPATGKVLYSTQVSTPKVDTTTSDKQEAKFDADVRWGIEQLQKGMDWKTVYTQLYTKYKNIGDEADVKAALDAGLGGGYDPNTNQWYGWASGGAYEAYKAKQTVAQ